jgi:hypothetical protein
MRFASRILLVGALTAIALIVAACGSGNNSAVPANARLINFSPVSVSENISNLYTIPATGTDSSSAYIQVPPGEYTISVSATGYSPEPSEVLGLGTTQNWSTLAYVRNGGVVGQSFEETLTAPTTGFTTLNVVNAAIDAGNLDVYILSPGASPVGNTPSFASVPTSFTSQAITFSQGTYDIVVTGISTPTDVRIRVPSVVLASAQAYTLGLTGTAGGELVNAVLVPQGISVPSSAFVQANQARVRVLSALAVGTPATVMVGTTTVSSLAVYPLVPYSYTLVPANSSLTSITVNSASIAIPASTFASGFDYTILLYYAPGTTNPVAAVLTDSNLPIVNSASIRFINVGATGADGATLLVNGGQVATNTSYGSASAYTGVTPGSGAIVELIGSGYSGPSPLPPPLPAFNSGSVYTIMLYDGTKAPKVFEDR